MKTLTTYLTEKAISAKPYAHVQVTLPMGLAQQILQWGYKNIKEEWITDNGREKDIHLTLLYGLHDQTPTKAKETLKGLRPFDIELGKVTFFKNNTGFNVLKISAYGGGLHNANKLLKQLPYSSDYPIYDPHVTISYLKKSVGFNLNGDPTFDGKKFRTTEVEFISTTGFKEIIPLF